MMMMMVMVMVMVMEMVMGGYEAGCFEPLNRIQPVRYRLRAAAASGRKCTQLQPRHSSSCLLQGAGAAVAGDWLEGGNGFNLELYAAGRRSDGDGENSAESVAAAIQRAEAAERRNKMLEQEVTRSSLFSPHASCFIPHTSHNSPQVLVASRKVERAVQAQRAAGAIYCLSFVAFDF
jgi:hypothetical protein